MQNKIYRGTEANGEISPEDTQRKHREHARRMASPLLGERVCPNSCDWPNCTLALCMYKDPEGWAGHKQESMIQKITQDHIDSVVKRHDELILTILKKQKGFVSLEESYHHVEVNRIFNGVQHLGTDYLFKGKRFLTIFPIESKEENGRFSTCFNYQEFKQ